MKNPASSSAARERPAKWIGRAAAVLVAADLASDLKQGVALGAEAIDSGQAATTLEKLRRFGAKYGAKR